MLPFVCHCECPSSKDKINTSYHKCPINSDLSEFRRTISTECRITYDFMSLLYNGCSSIKFMLEIKNQKQIPFLDVQVIRNCTKMLELDLIRKYYHTHRYLPYNSHHSAQHKTVSLNILVHRVSSFPLNSERFKNNKYHKDTTVSDEYPENLVHNIKRTKKC